MIPFRSGAMTGARAGPRGRRAGAGLTSTRRAAPKAGWTLVGTGNTPAGASSAATGSYRAGTTRPSRRGWDQGSDPARRRRGDRRSQHGALTGLVQLLVLGRDLRFIASRGAPGGF